MFNITKIHLPALQAFFTITVLISTRKLTFIKVKKHGSVIKVNTFGVSGFAQLLLFAFFQRKKSKAKIRSEETITDSDKAITLIQYCIFARK